MDAADLVAIYAAIVGTVALGWDIWKLRSEGPNLQVIGPPKHAYKPEIKSRWDGPSVFWIVYDVTLMNSGRKPITIVSGTVTFDGIPTYGNVGPGLAFYRSNPEDEYTFSKGTLPLKLDAGEARSAPVELKFECDRSIPFHEHKYDATLVFDLTTTEGRLNRKAEFSLSGYHLGMTLQKTPWN